ncbi:MAG: hypothetical protein WCJ54_06610 [Actinomycetota bacterium]
MQTKKLFYKTSMTLILVIFLAVLMLAGCGTKNNNPGETSSSKTGTTVAAQTTETTAQQSTEQLSEQPDKAKYDEYFTEFYLAKLPIGTEMGPSNQPIRTTVFIVSEDLFGSVMSVIKDIPAGSIAGAVYDIVAKKYIEPKTAFPMALKASNYAGTQPLKYPPGKYEYKVYVDDVLAINIPFEVLAGDTADSQPEATATEDGQGAEQLSEQPDKVKYGEYFVDFYIGKLPKGTQFGPYLGGQQFDLGKMPVKTAVFIAAEDEFCGVGVLKKAIPSGSLFISIYDAVAKIDTVAKAAFSQNLATGDFGWADDPINFPTGKYEYKIYIDDALVIVLPFEVR